MKKIILSALLIIALVAAMVPMTVSAAEGTAVSTVEEFEKMVSGGTYYLANDIDFGGKKYEGYIFEEFSGVLNGEGHCIFNFSINGEGLESDAGIIKRANKAGKLEINNLIIGKEKQPITLYTNASGKSHGILAGAQENANSAVFNDVAVYAEITAPTTGKANIGGFIGYSRAVSFINCSFNGFIQLGSGLDKVDEVYHNAAGFIGSCNSDMTSFDNCENNASITTYCSTVEARAAGFIAYTSSTVTMTKCRNNGEITVADCDKQIADGQCAGFVAHANKTSPVIFDYCENFGKINCSNWSAGFVANAVSGALFTGCVNEGEYNKNAVLSGPFVAFVSETAIVDYTGKNIDKIDPSVVWGTTAEDTTTATPPAETTTPKAEETTTPKVEEATTPTPAKETTTPAPTTTTTAGGNSSSGGCGSAMISVGLVAVLGAGWLALRKKEN